MALEGDALDQEHRRYGVNILGQWGEFKSKDPNSSIVYFSANARFSSSSQLDSESELLRHMIPVRELMEVKDLRFNELLQRDLDDFRVSTELVRYAAGMEQRGGATFFPPVLAVLLPHRNGEFSEMPQTTTRIEGSTHITEASPVFRLTRLLLKNSIHEDQLAENSNRRAELSWNDSSSKLVVIDGQHRVMALLALYRTVHDRWAHGEGWRYRNLYEDAVTRLLESEPEGLRSIPDVELPVTIILFPKLHGLAVRDAARKLFVDVNQGAKRPSASRLILLSDSDVVNVLTREFLEDIRAQDLNGTGARSADYGSPLLSAIEYDSPSINEERSAPGRPTCLMTLTALKIVTEYMISRNPRFVSEINPKRRKNEAAGNAWQRIKTSLDLVGQIGPMFQYTDEGEVKTIALAEVKPESAPKPFLLKVAEVNNRSYGRLFQDLLRQTEPYRSHLHALESLKTDLNRGGPTQALISEALFDGVGTFFTLRNLRDKYREEIRAMRAAGYRPPKRPSSADAFEGLEKELEKWLTAYSDELLGKSDDDSKSSLSKLKERTHSIAALAGLALTAAHLCHIVKTESGHSVASSPTLASSIAKSLALSLNKAQQGFASDGTTRALVLSGAVASPLNNLQKLEPDNCFEFRCLWLELLDDSRSDFLDSLVNLLPDVLSTDVIAGVSSSLLASIHSARTRLLDTTIKRITTPQFKRDHPDDSEQSALNLACAELLLARKNWFGWDEQRFSSAFGVTNIGAGQWVWVESEESVEDDEEDTDEEGDD